MNADELFRFDKNTDKSLGGYRLGRYLQREDLRITQIDIPAEYNGEPVTMIGYGCFSSARNITRVVIPPSVRVIAGTAFYNCTSLEAVELSEGLTAIGSSVFEMSGLKSVKLPKSLQKLGSCAFQFCKELERAEFGCEPSEFGARVFRGCDKLPPETLVMGLVRSVDITSSVSKADFRETIEDFRRADCDFFRPDVFELLAKNKCFRKTNVKFLFEKMISENVTELFPIAEKYGMLSNEKFVNMLIDCGIERENTELAAYLLELKNRKFGFDGRCDYDL